MIDDASLTRVHDVIVRYQEAVDAHHRRVSNDERYARSYRITGGPETGAIRRASLDLTRALAELRR